MEFLVDSNADTYGNATSVILREGADTVFDVGLPTEKNNIDGWCACFTVLHRTDPDRLQALFTALPELLEIEVDEEAQATYIRVLHALHRWLEEENRSLQEQTCSTYDLQELRDLQKQLENALFRLQVDTTNSEYYETVFPHPGEAKQPIRIPRNTFDQSPVEVSRVMLVMAYKQYPKLVGYFIDYHVRFQAYVTRKDSTTFKVFTGLSKALVRLIKHENTNLNMYMHHVPDICAFIVKNEPEGEEQKVYLESILSSLERVEKKLERLDILINDIHKDLFQREDTQPPHSNQQEEEGQRRLMHVISLISDHYLRLYDLDRSVSFWQKVKSKDLVLKVFLTLHRRPYIFVSIQLLLFFILSFFAYQHWNIPPQFPSTFNLLVLLHYIPLLLLLPWYIPPLLLAGAILLELLRKSKSKGQRWFLYSQLLLPRVLGASIVGVIPLFLNDQSWLIGIKSTPINWLLLALLAYSGSFLYIYIEVYNITKFLQGRSGANIFGTSMKIFLIAFTETLFIVTFTSTLIFPAVSQALSGLSGDKFGISANLSWLSFGFFPSLILLWTGIALFIGSFVQLLWQGQRITEAI